MPIGFHFDDVERAYFELDDQLYNDQSYDDQLYDLPPISGIHEDSDDMEDDSCIGGMHGEFRERYKTMTDKEKELYFLCCIARDRAIKADYFDFDKRSQISNFTKENKEVNEDAKKD